MSENKIEISLERQFNLHKNLLVVEEASREQLLDMVKSLLILTEYQQAAIKWLVKELAQKG